MRTKKPNEKTAEDKKQKNIKAHSENKSESSGAATDNAPKDAEEAVTPNAAALEFLNKWHTDRENWKFQKVRNTYILKNMYDPYKIPKASFKIVLEYLDGLKGNARTKTQQDAEAELSKLSEKSTEGMTDTEVTVHKIILYRCKKVAQRTSLESE
ncbi:hypothetical protein SARC_08468 [Sphaeroforma arctica JP610]|uniref:WKF domain-containing protein n=1 Tax=Sphaeroforma arctica JP610 TaxID=667725 RepID=A0A0L0FQR4_9EUKA|nr:hypothetical protein SARC_08468 [Sphaeroforma arctica JP610]KNC79127.1 hypothetical protein SARC_08468 [Sphaeroforma arctica JP610]|eukprot:XP_014153029.1 hypothetical protein SARC_08468 [Sphaeroforma arctica JP610]